MLLSAHNYSITLFFFFLVKKILSTLYFPENFLINVSDGTSLNAELWHFPEDIIIKLW